MVGMVMLEACDHNGGVVKVTFHAGETELTVEAIQVGTETATKARFNFLI